MLFLGFLLIGLAAGWILGRFMRLRILLLIACLALILPSVFADSAPNLTWTQRIQKNFSDWRVSLTAFVTNVEKTGTTVRKAVASAYHDIVSGYHDARAGWEDLGKLSEPKKPMKRRPS